jgi:hypothetical protein
MEEVVGCDKKSTQKGMNLSSLNRKVLGYYALVEMLVE